MVFAIHWTNRAEQRRTHDGSPNGVWVWWKIRKANAQQIMLKNFRKNAHEMSSRRVYFLAVIKRALRANYRTQAYIYFIGFLYVVYYGIIYNIWVHFFFNLLFVFFLFIYFIVMVFCFGAWMKDFSTQH